MPDLAKTLKEEIARIAKRESKKMVSAQVRAIRDIKSQIAALRQRLIAAEKTCRDSAKAGVATDATERAGAGRAAASDKAAGKWFTGRGVRALRAKLGMTQPQFEKLLGVSQKSVSKWEARKGKLRMRSNTLEALVAARGMGKREAHARIAGGKTSDES